MTEISQASIAKSQRESVETQQEASPLEESLSELVSRIGGSKISAAEISRKNVSEEILFAAQVHSELKEKGGGLADKFLRKIPEAFDRNVAARKSQPLFRAVDRFLSKAAGRGEITRKQKNQVIRNAFGNAQLDGHTGRLGRGVRKSAETSEEKHEEKQGAAVSRGDTQEPAARKTLKEFRQRINSRGKISEKRAERTMNALKEVTGGGKSTTSAGEGVTDTNPADYNSISTGPDEMVYRPSGTGGGAQIFVPRIYTDEVSGVRLVSKDGMTLNLSQKGVMGDGRRMFESTVEGTTLTGSIELELIFLDKSSATVALGDADAFKRLPFKSP